MKIKRLYLKNFAAIWVAMNKKKIDIDFSRCKNKICLLIGKNGSGKTSILSNLHPFPNLGTLDIRNNQELILEGKDGEKIFEFIDGNDEYCAHHYYQFKNNKRKTSCFLKKNGIELNPSGLVSSFYDILMEEFNLDSSFLKIIRLGPNVTDIISLKGTERKEFMTNFLSDIDVFLKAYKIVSEESKSIKNSLKLVSSEYDKINELKSLESEKENTEKELEILIREKETVKEKLFLTKTQMEKELLSQEEIEKAIADYKDNISYFTKDITDEEVASINKLYESLNNKKTDAEKNIEIINFKITTYKNRINDINENIISYTNKINSIQNNISLDELTCKIDNIKDELKLLDDSKLPLGQINNSNIYLDLLNEINKLDKSIQEFKVAIITNISRDKYNELIRNLPLKTLPKELSKRINKYLIKLSEQITLTNKNINSGKHDTVVLYVPEKCTEYKSCPFYRVSLNNKKENKNDRKKLEALYDSIEEVKNAISNLEWIYHELEFFNNRVSSEPSLQLNFEEVASNIILLNNYSFDSIRKKINNFIDAYDNYDKQNKLLVLLSELEKERMNFSEESSLSILKDELNKSEETKDELEKELVILNSELDHYLKIFNTSNNQLIKIEKDRNYYNYYKENKYLLKEIYNKYIQAKEMHKLVKEYNSQINNYNKQIEKIQFQIEKRNSYLNNEIMYKIKRKKELKEKQIDIKDKFEIVEVIRESLSSSKGIPLVFIQLYLKNIQIVANSIIQTMFDDSISLCNFVITDKEFSIPFMVNGIEIKDVSYASQGQRATIVMALSFAIMNQVLSRYNILLLDEMDGPLYKNKKQVFVKILEEQMERIKCDQAIMITHNSLFENYPVDIIFTSDEDEDEYLKSNVIWRR